MKRFILIAGSAILLILLVLLLGIFPSMFYLKIVVDGINNDLLQLPPSNRVEVVLSDRFLEKQKGSFSEEEGLWETQHFTHFELPFPRRHPQINFIPLLGNFDRPDYFSIGAKFENNEGNDFFSFYVGKPIKFDHLVDSAKLFQIPYFKNRILQHKIDEIWRDIFSLDLTLPLHQGWNLDNLRKSLVKVINKPVDRLVYQLYIIFMRYSLLDNRVGQIAFFQDGKRGVFEYQDKDSALFRNEEILLFDRGVVFRLVVKSHKNSFFPETIRRRFIVNTRVKEDREEDAIGLYSKFKTLSYDQKLEQTGLTTLYSAWSHVIDNKDFLKEIIRYLERGHGNYRALEPLYFYAYKKYGTNLSSQTDKIETDPQETLKRKMQEELERDIKKASNTIEDVHQDEFESPDDRVKYYLKKAKEMDVDLDKNSEFLDNQ